MYGIQQVEFTSEMNNTFALVYWLLSHYGIRADVVKLPKKFMHKQKWKLVIPLPVTGWVEID